MDLLKTVKENLLHRGVIMHLDIRRLKELKQEEKWKKQLKREAEELKRREEEDQRLVQEVEREEEVKVLQKE